MNSLPRLCLVSLAWVLGACGPIRGPQPEPDGGGCVEVVVHARPVAGGNCQQFSTPCEVPSDYVQCCGGLGFGACLGTGRCLDDPSDTCNPAQGDRDCTGVCQP